MILRTTTVLAVLLALPAAARAQDKIVQTNGQELTSINITALAYDKVSYEFHASPGTIQTIPVADVASIEWDPERKPFDLAAAEDHMTKGEFREAVDRLARVRNDRQAAPPFKEMALYLIVYCHAQTNDFKATIDAARAMREASPNSYYLPESFKLQFQAAREAGDAKEMEAALKEFGAAAADKNMPAWKAAMELMDAEVAESKGDFRKANGIYGKYARDKGQTGIDAKLGQLRCLAEIGDFGGLGSRADEAINAGKDKRDTGSLRLAMGGYTAKGEVLLSRNQPKEAVLELMRVIGVLAPRIGIMTPEHERALAKAVVACVRMAQTGVDKDIWKGRAHELLGELERYGKGRLYDAAQKELAGLK